MKNLLKKLFSEKDKGIEIPIGTVKEIEVPIPMYVGGIKENRSGKLLKRGNNFENFDVQADNFIGLEGYKGTFKIKQNVEAQDGFYHMKVVRENRLENYKEKIIAITNFYE